MTKTKAIDIMNELGAKESVYKILEQLDGETYSDAKQILDVVLFFLKVHTYLDASLAKSVIDDAV